MAQLVIISQTMQDRTFDLKDSKITVGRLPENGICIADDAISSFHAELIQKGSDYILKDLNSTNGTRVNGMRIVENRLMHGDTIHFAHFELRYLTSQKGSQPLPPLPKKLVDLSSTSINVGKRTTYSNASPFAKKPSPAKYNKAFKVCMIVGGLFAVSLFTIILFKLLKV